MQHLTIAVGDFSILPHQQPSTATVPYSFFAHRNEFVKTYAEIQVTTSTFTR